jgi:hypothetical protein
MSNKHGQPKKMDKIPAADKEMLRTAIKVAQRHGLAIELIKESPQTTHHQADAVARVRQGKQETLYLVECKRNVRTATLGVTLHQMDRLGQPAILITDYVAPDLADELKERGISFLDAAGNAYIKQANLLIWIKGQKPAAKATVSTPGRAFQPTGLQVIFTLLCNPQVINMPYRELAKMAGVAHGTVGWVIPDLQQLGFVRDLQGKRGTRRLFERERLLNQWTDAYARVLRPRTLIGRYYAPGFEGWKNWPLAEYGVLWGGEPAAAMLTEYLRPGELTLYAEKMPGLLAARQKFMKEAGPRHTAAVEVRKRFWNFPGDPEHINMVPPLLVYADLLATGDARCIETAKMIYDLHLARLFTEK